MTTQYPNWPREAFEFSAGHRRFAVNWGIAAGLDAGHASSLLRERLVHDWFVRGSLAAWYRRNELTAVLADDERLIASLLAEVESGRLRVYELEQPATPIYHHTYTRSEAPAPFEPEPTLNEFDPALDEPTTPDERVVEWLAIGDFNFSTGRSVMLPGPSVEGEREGDHADGLALIAGLLAHLRRVDIERRVIAAGHTDAAGSLAHNLELSERRAQSVKLACEGDADGFAAHAVTHGQVADGQEVLRWIALRFGWSCDPGPVDNDDGPKTSTARANFRERLQAEFGVTAGSGPAFERADWLGFFRLYEQDLAARMGVTPGGLPALRARLVWAEPPVLGCGEHWPEANVARSSVNRADRRVELLCFAPEHVPGGAGEPPGASVYGDPTYRWVPIQPGPGPHPLGGPCFDLALPSDIFGSPIEGVALRLQGGPYDLRHAVADARERGDFLVFHFHGIAKGSTYAAIVERDGAEPLVLFEEASLDTYITGIADLELQPEPISIHVFRAPERRASGGSYEYHEPPEDWEGIYEEYG